MGLDPEFPDYEEGDACPVCVDILFNGVTPKYVEIDVSGITKCPIAIGDPPNGTFLLTQVQPCIWRASVFPDNFEWNLQVARSFFKIFQTPFEIWFSSDWAVECYDAFVNQNICGVGPAYGANGYVLVWWGPTIGP